MAVGFLPQNLEAAVGRTVIWMARLTPTVSRLVAVVTVVVAAAVVAVYSPWDMAVPKDRAFQAVVAPMDRASPAVVAWRIHWVAEPRH